MKKSVIAVIAAIVVLVACCAIFVSCLYFLRVDGQADVFIQFDQDNERFVQKLDGDEKEFVISLLDRKIEYKEAYSCGFSSSLALLVDQRYYYIASDGCPFILDVETNKYIHITYEEKAALAELFGKYGGVVHVERMRDGGNDGSYPAWGEFFVVSPTN